MNTVRWMFFNLNSTCCPVFHSAFVHLFFSIENKDDINAAKVNFIIHPQFASAESVYYTFFINILGYICPSNLTIFLSPTVAFSDLMQKLVLSVFSTIINCI